MKDQILEILRTQGKKNVGELLELMSIGRDVIDRLLLELRHEGAIRRDQKRIQNFYYDKDFQCTQCNRAYPAVRRSDTTRICLSCTRDKYGRPIKAKKVARGPFTSTESRLAICETGPTWDGKRNQELLLSRNYSEV